MNLPQLPQDKANHAIYGAFICASLNWAIGPYALLVVAVVAIGKEVYDVYSKTGHGEKADALWTIVGGALVLF